MLLPAAPTIDVPWPAKGLRWLLQQRFAGSWRLAALCATRLRSLQAIPIRFGDWPPVYVDARYDNGRHWVLRSPFRDCPQEPELQALFRSIVRSGDVVVDVGANEGLHTVLFSRLVGRSGRVLAVEPNPQLLPCLRRTVAGLDNATLYEVAAGDTRGDASLHVPSDHSRASFANWTRGLGDYHGTTTLRVPVVPLDELLAPELAPALIKVDVEGAESLVLRGARGLLERADAPYVVFEQLELATTALGIASTAAIDFLSSLTQPAFKFYEVLEAGGVRPLLRPWPEWFDIIAVPAARHGHFVHSVAGAVA